MITNSNYSLSGDIRPASGAKQRANEATRLGHPSHLDASAFTLESGKFFEVLGVVEFDLLPAAPADVTDIRMIAETLAQSAGQVGTLLAYVGE